MTEENKYFTPDIEDIRVGYECEIWWNENMLPENHWCSIIVGDNQTEDFDLIDFTSRIRKNELRVPYLTKEQIQAEGWKYYSTLAEGDEIEAPSLTAYVYQKEGFTCRFSILDRKVAFFAKQINGDEWWKRMIFTGDIKDINTFRQIIKLLEIG